MLEWQSNQNRVQKTKVDAASHLRLETQAKKSEVTVMSLSTAETSEYVYLPMSMYAPRERKRNKPGLTKKRKTVSK